MKEKLSLVLVGFLCFLMLSFGFNVGFVYGFGAGNSPYPEPESPDVKTHNKIVWNALELLSRDGYDIEAGLTRDYMEDLQNGLCDADAGSILHGGLYDGVPLIDTRLVVEGQARSLGGFSHYFDAWDHHGNGLAENLDLLLASLPLAEIIYALGYEWLNDLVQNRPHEVASVFDQWTEWQGANGAEGARRDFNRAVQAWEAGDEKKAMYFLGYALHILADCCSPFHAAHTIGSGHSDFEHSVDQHLKENPDFYKIDRAPDLSTGFTQFSHDPLDHGIYLQDLYRLSDGIYIAGDSNLVDTDSSTDALRYGHITQLSDPIHRLIDFAVHEAIEWYPLVNDVKGSYIDFDDWWEMWNYVETRNDLESSFSSRLVFHFEGISEMELDFEGAWHNTEAIDMENWVSEDLGEVSIYNDYTVTNRIAGPYAEEGWLAGGPEVAYATETMAVQTDVTRQGSVWSYGDNDCDGWQLSEIEVWDDYAGEDIIPDPLLKPQPQYKTSEGHHSTLPLLDDPLPNPELANRTVAVHSTDLASKLSAGLIKQFFDKVNLPRGSPETTLSSMKPEDDTFVMANQYVDEYGRMYTDGQSFYLTATSYRTIYSPTQGKWVQEPIGNGISDIWYKIDDEPWQNHHEEAQGFYRTYISFDIFDELPHTIQYGSVNYLGEAEPLHTQIFQRDNTGPTTLISVGEPNELVDGLLHITPETPVQIHSFDSGSGANKTIVRLYYGPIGFEEDDCVQFRVEPASTTIRVPKSLMFHPNTFGIWLIRARGIDQVDNLGVLQSFMVELVPFIEGVDVSISPLNSIAQPGSSIDYTISIRNRYQTTQTYDLTLTGLNPSWVSFSYTSLTIGQEESAISTLTISPPGSSLITRVYPFTVTATLQGPLEDSDSADAQLGVVYEPELPKEPAGRTAVAVLPDIIQTTAGATVKVHIQVSNKMNFDDLISVKIKVADIREENQANLAWFSWTRISVFVPMGAHIDIPLTISIPQDTSIGYKLFDAIATSTALLIGKASARACISDDATPPSITIVTPQEDEALQDGVTFRTVASDPNGVAWVTFSVRRPNGEQGTIIDPILESIPATCSGDNQWHLELDTNHPLFPDGHYILLVKACDSVGNEGSETVQFSIRNWAHTECLPATANNRAGRTIPIKFTIRVDPAVDPVQPFVWNEELTIVISKNGQILQVSTYGTASTDYRIDSDDEIYITNFRTSRTPTTYMVGIYRRDMLITSFEFSTTK